MKNISVSCGMGVAVRGLVSFSHQCRSTSRRGGRSSRMPSSCSSSTEETVSFMIRSKETLGASCGSGGSADPCGCSAVSCSGAFSSAGTSSGAVSAAGFPSSSGTGWCGKWMIWVSDGWSSSGSSGPPEENTSSSTSAGKSISTGSVSGVNRSPSGCWVVFTAAEVSGSAWGSGSAEASC